MGDAINTLAQEQPASEKSALLSETRDENFPRLGANENVSTMKYVRRHILLVVNKMKKNQNLLLQDHHGHHGERQVLVVVQPRD